MSKYDETNGQEEHQNHGLRLESVMPENGDLLSRYSHETETSREDFL